MIRYKCENCGVRLESDTPGEKDICPACGRVCLVPKEDAKRTQRIVAMAGGGGALVVLLTVVVICMVRAGSGDSGKTPPSREAVAARGNPPIASRTDSLPPVKPIGTKEARPGDANQSAALLPTTTAGSTRPQLTSQQRKDLTEFIKQSRSVVELQRTVAKEITTPSSKMEHSDQCQKEFEALSVPDVPTRIQASCDQIKTRLSIGMSMIAEICGFYQAARKYGRAHDTESGVAEVANMNGAYQALLDHAEVINRKIDALESASLATSASDQPAGGVKEPPQASSRLPISTLKMPFSAKDIDWAIVWEKPTEIIGGWRCYEVSGQVAIKARDVGNSVQIGLRSNGLFPLFSVHLFTSSLFTPVEYDRLSSIVRDRRPGKFEAGRFSVTAEFNGDLVDLTLIPLAGAGDGRRHEPRYATGSAQEAKLIDSFIKTATDINWTQFVLVKDGADVGENGGGTAIELVIMSEAIEKLEKQLPPLSSSMRQTCEELLDSAKKVTISMYQLSKLNSKGATESLSLEERRRLVREQTSAMVDGLIVYIAKLNVLKKAQFNGFPSLR